jgi:hypothetical protein
VIEQRGLIRVRMIKIQAPVIVELGHGDPMAPQGIIDRGLYRNPPERLVAKIAEKFFLLVPTPAPGPRLR